jgi:hypothetical protein
VTQDALAELRSLYFQTTKQTIARDFDRAIDLLKSLPDESERERAAVYMDGLAQMKSQWVGHGTSAGRAALRRVSQPGDDRPSRKRRE